jgi:hypothetical protein
MIHRRSKTRLECTPFSGLHLPLDPAPDPRKARRRIACLFVGLGLLWGSRPGVLDCGAAQGRPAAQPAPVPWQDARQGEQTLKLRFRHPGSGFGEGEIVITVKRGKEAATASQKLIGAVQSLGYSLTVRQTEWNYLTPGQEYLTDITPVDRKLIEAYNRSKQPRLPDDHRYGLQYAIRYRVVGQEFQYVLSAILYQRGSLSPWQKYPSTDYDAFLFAQRLTDKIELAFGVPKR